jgi:hypothetical protein
MNGSLTSDIETWENDGGAVPAAAVSLSGSAAQVEWAERIRQQVNVEFDRVAASFRSIASQQSPVKRAETEVVIAILEEKRAEVMCRAELVNDFETLARII